MKPFLQENAQKYFFFFFVTFLFICLLLLLDKAPSIKDKNTPSAFSRVLIPSFIFFQFFCLFLFYQILLLNGTYDRETEGMLASDYIWAITNSLNRTYGEDSLHRLSRKVGLFLPHLALFVYFFFVV